MQGYCKQCETNSRSGCDLSLNDTCQSHFIDEILNLGRVSISDYSSELVAHHQDGELLNRVELIGAQRSVIEAALQIGVSVLIEINAAATALRIDLDVDLGQRFVLILAQYLQLADILHHVHGKSIAVICLRNIRMSINCRQ
jgi:hypothetical protein